MKREPLGELINVCYYKGLLLFLDLSDESYALLDKFKIPYIFLSISNNRGIPVISSDDYLLGYKSTSYLIKNGHENIALSGIDKNSFIGGQLIAGYQQALLDHGCQ